MALPGGLGSPAATDLGLGGALSQQVQNETEDERKKRMEQERQRSMLGPSATMLGFGGAGILGGGFGR